MSKILIVDDEPMMLMVTKKILSEKYTVLQASSAREALEIYEKEGADLILTDLFMPEMTGFEMHKVLQEKHNCKIPVVYLTADETDEAEEKGFDLGAADFIRKPFRADVLLRRVDNILKSREMIRDLTEEATTDHLTGLLNKAGAEKVFTEDCMRRTGFFMMIDLDSFKLVNDLYGHDYGDEILKSFAKVIRDHLKEEDTSARIGGDEFAAFMNHGTESQIAVFTEQINAAFLADAKRILGDEMKIPLGASVGAVSVPAYGKNYEELFKLADHVLYKVKQNGKHGYAFYGVEEAENDEGVDPIEEMKKLSMVLSERNVSNGAWWLGQEAFTNVWRFLVRFYARYQGTAYKLLFTVAPKEAMESSEFDEIMQNFGEHVCSHLRKSDLMMQSHHDQFFVILPELDPDYIDFIIQRILDLYQETEFGKKVVIHSHKEPFEGLA